jgi:thiosulfate/3-mercaptopyruvate sulfurtransferase
MPNTNRNVRQEFLDKRIPDSQLFEVDEISDKTIPLPHMLPKPEDFARLVSDLGVSNDDHVVCYDQSGIYFASARVWWTFRVFGHDNVSVLDGGIQKWQNAGFQTTSGPCQAAAKVRASILLPLSYESASIHLFAPIGFVSYRAGLLSSIIAQGSFKVSGVRSQLVKSMDEMRKNVNTQEAQVADARPNRRFLAKDPEPRAQLLGGHIPHSVSLEFGKVLDREKFELLPKEKLAQVWKDAGVDLSKPLITTCGSGISASVLALSAALLGKMDVAVYDGSWSEWGIPEHKNPIAK